MLLNKNNSAYLIGAIFLVALVLRLWGLADERWYRADDAVIIAAAKSFPASGHFSPDDWIHPPLKYFLLQASMKLFGDNAYGWRMKNVLLGSLTVFAVFLLAKTVFPDPRIACLAALFLAIEPLHVMFSSTIFEEISATFCFVLAVTFLIGHAKRELPSPLLAGIFLGLAFAQKWYYLFAVLAFIAFALACKYRDGQLSWSGIIHVASVFALIPISIYVLTYYPWIKNGYSLVELVQMQADAYRIQQGLGSNMFMSEFFAASPSHPSEWFVKPLIYENMAASPGAAWGHGRVLMNNPLVWLLAFPAACFSVYRAVRDKQWYPLFLLLIFAALYLQFTVIQRPMYLYSAIVVLPFVYILVAGLMVALLDACGKNTWMYPLALLGTAAWGLYLYPLVTGVSVPLFLYKPLFYLGNLFLS